MGKGNIRLRLVMGICRLPAEALHTGLLSPFFFQE